MRRRNQAASGRRPLGGFERAQILTGKRFPYNLVTVVRLEGALPRERLRRALDDLQRRTPLLRAIVEGSGRGAAFRLADTPKVGLRVESAEPRDWRRRVEQELESGFEIARGPLVRCLYLTLPAEGGIGSGDLLMTFHHAIADGVAVARLLRDLLTTCAGGSVPAPAAPVALPPSADERFPARYRTPGGGARGLRFLLRQGADEIAFRWRRRRRPSRPPAAAARCRVLTTSLSAAETRALTSASYRQGVSLTAALQAAMLIAVSRRRYGGERLLQRYFTFPIVRPHLEPPIEPGVFGSYLIALRFTVEVAGDDEPWRLAAEIGRQIDGAASGDDKFLAAIWSPLSMRAILGQKRQRMGTTALSYTGPLTLETAGRGPEGLLVRDVHVFVSNFPLGPEYTAQARIFRGRLVWDIVYLDADMTADEAWAIAREMKARLGDAVAAGRSVSSRPQRKVSVSGTDPTG